MLELIIPFRNEYHERIRTMYRELNEKEKTWLDKLLAIDFKEKKILNLQLSKAKVEYIEEYAYISLKFKIDSKIAKYPYSVRVPVEMRAYQEGSAPIIFLLHIIDGIIYELEIITADSSKINVNSIDLEKVEYEVNKEVQL